MDPDLDDVVQAGLVDEHGVTGASDEQEVIGFLLHQQSDGVVSVSGDTTNDEMIKQFDADDVTEDEKVERNPNNELLVKMDQVQEPQAGTSQQQSEEMSSITLQDVNDVTVKEETTTAVHLLSNGQAIQLQIPVSSSIPQAISLPDGTTAFIQHPTPTVATTTANKDAGLGIMKLVEGQAIELEDGTMAYVQNTPKLGEGLQAIQLEDGTTAFISQSTATSMLADDTNVLNLGQLQAAQEAIQNQELAEVKEVNSLMGHSLTSPLRISSERALALGDKAYRCVYDGCGRLYTTQHHLKVHERSHTGDRPFKCEFANCSKAFATGYGLKSHTRVHTGEKPYKCPDGSCTKAFKTSGDLQKHVRTHTGERPFKCPFEGCTRSFTTSNIRKVHIRTHTGERPYVCNEEGCMKAFASATNYKNHIRIHTGEKPYVCTVSGCGKRFTEYSSLYKHHVVHTHSKPYICNHCGKNYRQTSTLAMHKRTAHGDESSSIDAEAALLLQQADEAGITSETLAKAGRISLQLVAPGLIQNNSQDDNEGALIINTSEPQQRQLSVTDSLNTSAVVGAASSSNTVLQQNDVTLAALQHSQQTAQLAIQQLQQGHGITLASDQDGQQIYVVTDPAQLEALQQLAQHHLTAQGRVIEQEEEENETDEVKGSVELEMTSDDDSTTHLVIKHADLTQEQDVSLHTTE